MRKHKNSAFFPSMADPLITNIYYFCSRRRCQFEAEYNLIFWLVVPEFKSKT